MHLHGLANGILSLDIWEVTTTDSEVLSDHTKVVVPALVVSHHPSIELFERKSRDIISQGMLGENLGRHLDRVFLVIN